MVNVPGIEIQLGKVKRVLPPLNAAAFKTYRAEITKVFDERGLPDLAVVATLAHAALQRNYPDLSIEDVENDVDFGNLVEVFEAVMNVSGLTLQAGKMARRILEATSPPSTT